MKTKFIECLLMAVLICITGYYAWETQQMKNIMRDDLSISNRPYLSTPSLKVKSHTEDVLILQIIIQNDGKTPAKEPKLEMSIPQHNFKKSFEAGKINPGKKSTINIHISGYINMIKNEPHLNIKINYGSIFENEIYCEESTFKIKYDSQNEKYPSTYFDEDAFHYTISNSTFC